MAKKLTGRQNTVLETIRGWIREHGYPPTIRELGQRLGIKSLRGVTTHLDAIAKKGFLKRASSARSISLLDLVEPFERALRIPLVGRIKAGKPVLAQEQVEDHVVIDSAWLGAQSQDASEHFALKVSGDSMINAGILDGDTVIVRQQQTAINGDIVVVLLGEDATLKRFYKTDDGVRFQPEHPTQEALLFNSQQSPLAILGKVVAVFRTLS